MKTIDILNGLDWFTNVGQPSRIIGESVVGITDWDEAIESCAEPNWDFICTEARNILTIHLNSVCKAEFQSWNEVINDSKTRLAEPWKRMRSKLNNAGLPQIVADCVEWDTMHAVACEYYSEWNPPQFFKSLFMFYEEGHFPCGWIGIWPEGKLRVF